MTSLFHWWGSHVLCFSFCTQRTHLLSFKMAAGNVCLKQVSKHWDLCILSEPIGLHKQYVLTEARQRDVSKKYGLKVKMSQRGGIKQAFSGHFLPNGRTECLLYYVEKTCYCFSFVLWSAVALQNVIRSGWFPRWQQDSLNSPAHKADKGCVHIQFLS